MKRKNCRRDNEILQAFRAGELDGEPERHVESCAVCREMLAVERLLGAEVEVGGAEARLPSAAQAWWRLERRARREALRKATSPIRWLETASLAAGSIAVFLLLRQAGWFETLMGTALSGAASLLPETGTGSLALAAGSSLLLVFLFALYLDWAEG